MLSKRLVDVYDQRGEKIRSFGEMSDSSEDAGAKPLMNRGWFYCDSDGNVYFNLAYLPDLTIRKYDRYGYAAYDIALPWNQLVSQNSNSNWDVRLKPEVRVAGVGTIGATSDASQSSGTSATGDATSGMATRLAGDMPTIGEHGMRAMEGGPGEIGGGGTGDRPGGFHRPGVAGVVGVMQLTRRPDSADSKLQIDALAVDPANQEIWAAIGGDLVHFDKDGNLAGYYCLSAADQAQVRPTTILVEPDRILIGTDPFGVFEYRRDK